MRHTAQLSLNHNMTAQFTHMQPTAVCSFGRHKPTFWFTKGIFRSWLLLTVQVCFGSELLEGDAVVNWYINQ